MPWLLLCPDAGCRGDVLSLVSPCPGAHTHTHCHPQPPWLTLTDCRCFLLQRGQCEGSGWASIGSAVNHCDGFLRRASSQGHKHLASGQRDIHGAPRLSPRLGGSISSSQHSTADNFSPPAFSSKIWAVLQAQKLRRASSQEFKASEEGFVSWVV